jgi:hypothetical protein
MDIKVGIKKYIKLQLIINKEKSYNVQTYIYIFRPTLYIYLLMLKIFFACS